MDTILSNSAGYLNVRSLLLLSIETLTVIFKFRFLNLGFQLVIFGYERSEFVDYVEKNNIALKHLYLKNWENSYETMPYPPAVGTYGIYTIEDLKDHINFALERVSLILCIMCMYCQWFDFNHSGILLYCHKVV